ncbi:endonuclease/exonuclease/phosphatase family protein [Elusimicrobiota bacterium]
MRGNPAALAASALAISLLAACGDPAGETTSPHPPGTPSDRVSVMTFNVQNLFDARDDPGKDDRAFLPLSKKATAGHKAACSRIRTEYRREQCLNWDWSERVVGLKLKLVAETILQVGSGRGPDILVLQEVENLEILERLRTRHLAAAAYRPGILIEGDDIRGIDVAMLSRFETAEKPRLRKIPYTGMTRGQLRGSRGVLEASFRLPDGESLSVLALHLPAPFHPRSFREQALRFLNTRLSRLPKERMVVAAGDFNITAEEDAEHRLFDSITDSSWVAAHRIGCPDCLGSNYYAPKNSWSFLDIILLSKNLGPEGGASWGLLPGSVRLANDAPQQKGRYGAPQRFDPVGGAGVSDHWPLVLELAKRR